MPKRAFPIQQYCPWCNRLIRTRKATLVLHDSHWVEAQLERFGKHDWLNKSYHFSHNVCEPSPDEDEAGYYVGLDRFHGVRRDNLEDWKQHLERKLWWSPSMLEGLIIADLIAHEAGNRPVRAAISPRIRAKVFERDGFRCRRCGHGPPRVTLDLDHIKPVSRGGTDDEDNLQTLCTPCNMGKRDRAPTPHDLAAGS